MAKAPENEPARNRGISPCTVPAASRWKRMHHAVAPASAASDSSDQLYTCRTPSDQQNSFAQHHQRLRGRLGAERHPAEADERERQQRCGNRRSAAALLRMRAPPRLVNRQRRAVQRAPEHEVRPRAVPQSAEHHRQHEVDVRARAAPAVAAERNVEVFLEPCGQADVPALPELADVAGDVRQVEVALELVAERVRAADRHVRIAGKVEVDLQRVGHNRQRHGRRIERQRRREYLIDEHRQVIRQHDLLEHAPREQVQPAPDGGASRAAVLLELRQEVRRLDDRSRDQLRKEGDVQRKAHQVAADGQLAAIDVDRIAQALKGVKRDADRQDDAQRPRLCDAEQRAEGIDEEIRVLEYAQHRQRRRHAQRAQSAPPLRPARHAQSREKGGQRQGEHQKAEPPIPPAVKHIAARQQNPLPRAQGAHDQLAEQHGGEQRQKRSAGKAHVVAPLSPRRHACSASATISWPTALRWPAPAAVLAKPCGSAPLSA